MFPLPANKILNSFDMMKHELEKQLDALEKKGVDRRHFFKLLAATGLIAGANTGKANAFQAAQKVKSLLSVEEPLVSVWLPD